MQGMSFDVAWSTSYLSSLILLIINKVWRRINHHGRFTPKLLLIPLLDGMIMFRGLLLKPTLPFIMLLFIMLLFIMLLLLFMLLAIRIWFWGRPKLCWFIDILFWLGLIGRGGINGGFAWFKLFTEVIGGWFMMGWFVMDLGRIEWLGGGKNVKLLFSMGAKLTGMLLWKGLKGWGWLKGLKLPKAGWLWAVFICPLCWFIIIFLAIYCRFYSLKLFIYNFFFSMYFL